LKTDTEEYQGNNTPSAPPPLLHQHHEPQQEQQTNQSQTIKIGYIDRQGTNRRLPDEFHYWLVEYLQDHIFVDFYHLHMEEYSAESQILLSQQLDMMVGVHGNGLTHQFWMQPQSYVLEFFWNYPFQYDYASSAMLLNHTYRGLYNGVILNETRISHRETEMLLCCPEQDTEWNHTSAQTAVREFVEKALVLGQR
jgi:protein O-GlcNAc transferase